MAVVVLAGLGAGLGIMGFVVALHPARPQAAMLLVSLDRSRGPRHQAEKEEAAGWPHRRMVRQIVRSMDARGWVPPTVVALAKSVGTTTEELFAQSLLGCVAGLMLPVAVSALLALGGMTLPLEIPAWSGAILGLAGAGLPILVLRGEASQLRRVARISVAAYLDLVVLCLAGGMGIESALLTAAVVADDEFSSRVVDSLERSRHSGETPWHALAGLGEDLGINELVELAAAVRLAGTEGARIRSTLSVKAASIRRHQLADAEAEANTVTERLFLPGVFLLVGFLVFVSYPAVARITGGF